jgi:hypothetical protein
MRFVSNPMALLCLLILCACDSLSTPSNVKISELPAEGLTESSFDQGYLTRLTEETREVATQRLEARYESNKIPARERISRAETSGHYEQFGGHRLAVIDLTYSANPMRVSRIIGIQEDRLISISCISPTGAPIDLLDEQGECGQALARHFPSSAAR